MINFAEEIKNKITMKEVCEQYGIDVGKNGKAICPFHTDHKPSMQIYKGSRGYFCFVCNEGGDIIDFVQKFFNIDFSEACAKINEDFCLGLPIGKQLTLREYREAEKAASERRKRIEAKKAAHKKLVDDYYFALDYYIALDRQRIEYSPERLNGCLIDFYVEAVKNIDYAELRLSEAETRLYEHEHNGQ